MISYHFIRMGALSGQRHACKPNLQEERTESVKAFIVASVTGSLVAAPVKLSMLLAQGNSLDQWEYSTLALAIMLGLFGVVYRCTVRVDDNDMLKQGCVGAFALCRALALTNVKHMGSPEMWLSIGTYFGESVLAFGGACYALGEAYRAP